MKGEMRRTIGPRSEDVESSNLKEPLAVGSKMMMLTVRCACKRQHTDRSEVTNGYGVLCGCESGIFENVPTREGEECKVCSIKTRARLARDDSGCDSGDDNECDSGDSENGSATIVTIVATIVAIVRTEVRR